MKLYRNYDMHSCCVGARHGPDGGGTVPLAWQIAEPFN